MVNTGVAPCVPETSVIRGSERQTCTWTESAQTRDLSASRGRFGRDGRRAAAGAAPAARAAPRPTRIDSICKMSLWALSSVRLSRLRTPTSDVQRRSGLRECISQKVSCLRFNITQSARV